MKINTVFDSLILNNDLKIFTTIEEANKCLKRLYKLHITQGCKKLTEILKRNKYSFLRTSEKTAENIKRFHKAYHRTQKYIFQLKKTYKSL